MKNNDTILVLDSDKGFTDLLEDVLNIKGLKTTIVNSADKGVKKLKKENFKAIVLDPFLDEKAMAATELVALVRETQDTPVLALSGVSSVSEKVRVLDAGADDYLTKPCALAELIARINSLLRQGEKLMFQGTKFAVGDIEFDVKTFILLKDEKSVKLTKDEYNTLYYLWVNSGKVMSAQQICSHALAYKKRCSPNDVRKIIADLRRKLRNNVPELIETVKTVGYTMNNKKIAAPESRIPKTPMVGKKKAKKK